MSDKQQITSTIKPLLDRGIDEITNADIFVRDVILNEYASLGTLLRDSMLEEFFEKLDGRAKRYKFWFNTLGQSSLISIIFVLLIATWGLVLAAVKIERIMLPHWLLTLSAILGILSVLITLFTSFLKLKRKWIYTRYCVERVRQWKYTILLDGNFVESSMKIRAGSTGAEADSKIKEQYSKRLKLFLEEISDYGKMAAFLNSDSPDISIRHSAYVNDKIFHRVLSLYKVVRLNWQVEHFRRMDFMLKSWDRWTDGLAKSLLGLSGLLAITDAVVTVFSSEEANPSGRYIIAGVAITLAILSATLRVYRNATAIAQERERYDSKATALEIIKVRIDAERDMLKIQTLMVQAEEICLQELREFLKALRESEYYL